MSRVRAPHPGQINIHRSIISDQLLSVLMSHRSRDRRLHPANCYSPTVGRVHDYSIIALAGVPRRSGGYGFYPCDAARQIFSHCDTHIYCICESSLKHYLRSLSPSPLSLIHRTHSIANVSLSLSTIPNELFDYRDTSTCATDFGSFAW